MEDTATIDTGTAEAQSTETESAAPETTATQAAPKDAGAPSISALLKREKDDPNVQFNDAELDALDAHYAKVDAGKTKTKAAEPKEAKEEDDGDEPKAKPKVEPEEEPEEAEEPEEVENAAPTAEAKAILKELGAKDLKDAYTKIKGLKSLTGSRDAQAVAKLQREKEEVVNGGKALWSALAKGDAQAIAFAEKTFGVKFASKGNEQHSATVQSGDRFIDRDKFIDPESADLAEAAFTRQEAKIKALEDRFGKVEEERDRHIKDTVAKQATMTVVDEMAQIASKHPELKSLSGFREIAEKVLRGEPDPRLDVFTELFEIAQQEKCSLNAAYLIKRGRDTDLIEAQAVQKGLKQAYNQKPNPSLSGASRGKGEESYQPVTEAQLEAWAADHTTHPDHWYDKDENPIQSKIPKRAWKLFGFKTA